MASVVSCSAAKRSAPPAWQKPNRCSLACSRNSDCPVASAPTTGCPLPPTPWLASHSSRRGGYASASYPSSSNPVNRNRTDAMNACIERSKPKRPDPRLTPVALNSANSIASARSSTPSVPTKHSTCKLRHRSMNLHHVKCPIGSQLSSTPTASKYVTLVLTAESGGTSNG